MSRHVRRGREEDERKDKNYTEAVIGIVNNSSDPLRDVALSVEFFERDPPPSSKRYSTAIRPLFFEGPLLPGQAIKWDVQARGSEFDVHNPLTGTVGVRAACGIYEWRPNPCRELEPGSDGCERARARHGLPPLEPDQIL